jgi:hypothetical protein
MFYIKQNDTSPAIRVIVKDADGVVINVTGASVMFHMTEIGSSTPAVDAAGAVVDGTAGVIEYQWETGDTADAGNYNAEFQVTYVDSTIETFPNNTYIKVKITPELS